jgi:hypothetical protein
MQCACAALSSVTFLVLHSFSILCHKGYDFRGGGNPVAHKTVLRFSLQILSEVFLTLRIIQRDITTNVHRSSCKVPAVLVRLSEPSCFMWKDRRTDVTKLIVSFHNFSSWPKDASVAGYKNFLCP